ncbi:MAG: hypothetical protein ABEK50_05490, partial [bacterium]
LWLARHDMVRRMLFMPGERGYTGWCLFTGYVWLGLGGLLGILYPAVPSGFLYDAFLHSVFVGFVFAMIFGHAFMIMPGVLKVNLNFHAGFYLPFILLEVGLVIRLTGDFFFQTAVRQAGATLNAVAIVFFFVLLIQSALSTAPEDAEPVHTQTTP